MPYTPLQGTNNSRLANILLGSAPTSLPVARVQPVYAIAAAFGIAPGVVPAVGDWVNLSAYVRAVSIRRGRQHELSRTQAGTAQLRLSNLDRRFDPSNPSSPYYPNLVPMTQIRVQVTLGAATYDLFRGYVQDWGQDWSPRPLNSAGAAECQVQLVDGFGVLAMFDISQNLYSQQVLADTPAIYCRLADPAGSSVLTNEGSVTTNLVPSGSPTLGYTASVPLTGGQSVLSFPSPPSSNFYRDSAPDASLKTMENVSLEAWVRLRAAPGATQIRDVVSANDCWRLHFIGTNLAFTQVPTTGGPGWYVSAEETLRSTTSVSLGVWYHVVALRDMARHQVRLYVNGTLESTFHFRKGLVSQATYSAISVGMDSSTGAGIGSAGVQMEGELAHVAVYDYVLSDARIAVHASMAADSFGRLASGAAVGTALDAAGWPAAARAIDAGRSQLQAHDPASSALEEILAIAEDTDRGLFFMRGDGVAVFLSRATLQGLSYALPVAVWGDSASETSYTDLVLTNDDTDLYNTVTAQRIGGDPHMADDGVSQTRYGLRSLDVTGTLHSGDGEVIDLANALLARYKDPHTRPQSMVVLGGFSDPPLTQMATMDLGQVVTVVRRPPGGGAAIAINARVEGISHEIAGGQTWLTTWDLVPAEATFWILDDPTYSVLGVTTRLSY